MTSREADDPAIALLDAWATVGDVLTFYQERIANEGYLRTATERRSVLELARLVGYQPRPGVAASVYLAYTIDPNYKEETVIPAGSRFTEHPGTWRDGAIVRNQRGSEGAGAVEQSPPPNDTAANRGSIRQGDGAHARLYLKGISTNLKPNDPLLIDFGNRSPRVSSGCRKLFLMPLSRSHAGDFTVPMASGPKWADANEESATQVSLIKSRDCTTFGSAAQFVTARAKASEQFSSSGRRVRTVERVCSSAARNAHLAVANANVTPKSEIKLYALRLAASFIAEAMRLGNQKF